jgi:nitrogen-specific signal transduction histidine kinase
MARNDERGAIQHERARRAVFGFLGSAILHETNNVLTVMAGVRQLLKAGIALSDRVGTMIDQQLARMEELVGWIRRLGPDDGDPAAPPRTLAFVTESVEKVLLLAGKGRGVVVERHVDHPDARARDPEALGLALLALLLPALPMRGGGNGGTKITLRCALDGATVRIVATLAAARATTADEPEWNAARALLADVGGSLVVAAPPPDAALTVELPAAD